MRPGIARTIEMALLSPFRSSNESFFPESLKQRLKSFGLLDDIGDVALRRLLAEADWFGLPGGTQLARDGEHDRAIFLVVTGSLGVLVCHRNTTQPEVAAVS